jgi:hypothetical protein
MDDFCGVGREGDGIDLFKSHDFFFAVNLTG